MDGPREIEVPLPPPPPDAQYVTHGVNYKIGRHGLVFRWGLAGWVRSTKTIGELNQKVAATACRVGKTEVLA
jgi:hypothetical protein